MVRPVDNFKATFLFKDIELFRFSIDAFGEFDEYTILAEKDKLHVFPIEFVNGDIDIMRFQQFLRDRIVPETRHKLKELLAANGIYSYDVKAILQATHGLCTDDCYWMKFPGINDTLKYDDIKLRD